MLLHPNLLLQFLKGQKRVYLQGHFYLIVENRILACLKWNPKNLVN
jgi:hypothetical protein